MKQHKIKVLLDMEQLGVDGKKGTGIVRVAYELLKGLFKDESLDVYPLVTSNRGDVAGYLDYVGLSELKAKMVYLPMLRKTCKWDNAYKKAVSWLAACFYGKKYMRVLNDYDAYISIFSPISPIVYASKLKTFAFVHDLIPIKFPQFCNAKFAKKYKQWIGHLDADRIFTISNSTKKDLLEFRKDILPNKVEVVYLGADAKFKPITDDKIIAEIKQKYGIDNKKYILAVSELSERKNFVHLLRAFAKLIKNTKDDTLYLVLLGPKRAGFKAVDEEIVKLNIKDKIIQTGFVADEDMPILYSGAEVFVYPSLYEGFGLPILEAMQCGTPVICTDNSSLPEVGGDAVLYIDGKDIDKTAEALKKVCKDSGLRLQLAQKSVKQSESFSWNKFIQQIKTIIVKECSYE